MLAVRPRLRQWRWCCRRRGAYRCFLNEPSPVETETGEIGGVRDVRVTVIGGGDVSDHTLERKNVDDAEFVGRQKGV